MTADELITAIESLPGNKIVTLLSPTSANPHMAVGVHDKEWGYEGAHLSLFTAKLTRAINSGGSVIVRHFLKTTFLRDGRWLPHKKIYGWALGNGVATPVPRAAMATSFNTDADTGDPLPPEPGLSFSEWGE